MFNFKVFGGGDLVWFLQILITHEAPLDILGGYEPNSQKLREAIAKNPPLLHVFGHHHENYGIVSHTYSNLKSADNNNDIKAPKMKTINFVNCAILGKPLHDPIVFDVQFSDNDDVLFHRVNEVTA